MKPVSIHINGKVEKPETLAAIIALAKVAQKKFEAEILVFPHAKTETQEEMNRHG
jgi:hypothetical protein